MKLETLLQTLESGGVIRFHACTKMRKQSLSDHQWKVALIAEYLLSTLSKAGLMHALTHDRLELVTGDIPATLKWEHPEIKEFLNRIEACYENSYQLSPLEKIAIKMADILEGMLFCKESYEDGCKDARNIFSRWINYLFEYRANPNTKDILLRSGDEGEILLERLSLLIDECIPAMTGAR